MFFRYDFTITNAIGEALPDVVAYVCTQPANTSVIPPSPLATIYSNSSGTPLVNPVIADGNGNGFFYAASGLYTILYDDPFDRIPVQIYPDQNVPTPGSGGGSGTVTSVALTTPAFLSVTGSPITVAGTIALTLTNQNANLVFAGPSSGGAAAPTFRTLVSADLPAGLGTVSSIALTLTGSALFTLGVTGSPITTSGTLALTVNFTNQAAHAFLVGPATGSSAGPITARLMVPADLPPQVVQSFAATQVFDASAGTSFTLTLTGNVTSSSVTNPTAGEIITFIITQDGIGNWAFAWPTNFKGASVIGAAANSISVQSFIFNGTFWLATGVGLTM